nr:ROK family protein [Rhizobium grahamii]
MFLDGQLYKGSRSNAGEIGHMIAVSNGLPCVCGKRGCLDRYVSLGAAYDYLNITAHGQAWTRSPDIVAGLSQDRIDAWAETAAEAMRQTIDVLELAFDPQTIVLGGSMPTRLLRSTCAPSRAIAQAGRTGQERVLPRIITGAIGRDTALLGAAALPIFSATNPQFDVLQKPLRQKPQE